MFTTRRLPFISASNRIKSVPLFEIRLQATTNVRARNVGLAGFFGRTRLGVLAGFFYPGGNLLLARFKRPSLLRLLGVKRQPLGGGSRG